MSAKHAACPDELREALDSPVPSIRTPFTANGQIDYNGVRSQVDFLIAGKARTLMLTWGDSMYSVLTDDQVAELARVVIEHNNGRAKVIAADKSWATPKAVSYAEYCSDPAPICSCCCLRTGPGRRHRIRWSDTSVPWASTCRPCW